MAAPTIFNYFRSTLNHTYRTHLSVHCCLLFFCFCCKRIRCNFAAKVQHDCLWPLPSHIHTHTLASIENPERQTQSQTPKRKTNNRMHKPTNRKKEFKIFHHSLHIIWVNCDLSGWLLCVEFVPHSIFVSLSFDGLTFCMPLQPEPIERVRDRLREKKREREGFLWRQKEWKKSIQKYFGCLDYNGLFDSLNWIV